MVKTGPINPDSGTAVIKAATSVVPYEEGMSLTMYMSDPHFQLAQLVGMRAVVDVRDGLQLLPIRWHADALEVTGNPKTPEAFQVLQDASFAAGKVLAELGFIDSEGMYA